MKVLLWSQNWGYGRGVAYLARTHVKSLLSMGAEVTVLCYGQLDKQEPEFDLPIKVVHTENFWSISRKFFENLLDQEKPDYVFFYEYDQWKENPDNLIDICLEKGTKPVGAWIAWEKLFSYMVPKFKKFYKIFVHTKEQVKLFRKFGLTNSYYIPFGMDLTEFEGEHKPVDDKIVFLHTSGFGGVNDRRNTKLVTEAYEMIKDENTKLILTSQKVQSFPFKFIRKLYKDADCYLCPSKWEGLGMTNVEAIISGTPVITTNYPPMNELVKANTTGMLVNAYDWEKTEDIGVAQQIIEPEDLAEVMKIIKNKMIREVLRKGCERERENFSLEVMTKAMEKELR